MQLLMLLSCPMPDLLTACCALVHAACAPGYHGPTCQACPIDSWCAGADAAAQSCGSCLSTVGGRGARTPTDCVTKPGCGIRLGGGGALLCPNNTYSTGGNQAACLPCPAGLVTAGEGSSSINQCASPPGYLWQVGYRWLFTLFALFKSCGCCLSTMHNQGSCIPVVPMVDHLVCLPHSTWFADGHMPCVLICLCWLLCRTCAHCHARWGRTSQPSAAQPPAHPALLA